MELLLAGKKTNADVKKVVPSMTWKGDPIVSFCVGESIRKANLHKQTHNMSTNKDLRNKDITKGHNKRHNKRTKT